jgi:hypothetical protein
VVGRDTVPRERVIGAENDLTDAGFGGFMRRDECRERVELPRLRPRAATEPGREGKIDQPLGKRPQPRRLVPRADGQGMRPSGLNATDDNGASWRKGAISRPVATSQSRAVLSPESVARVRPSGLKATDNTASSWPRKAAISRPAATSHSRAVLSSEAVARVRPSGLKATDNT